MSDNFKICSNNLQGKWWNTEWRRRTLLNCWMATFNKRELLIASSSCLAKGWSCKTRVAECQLEVMQVVIIIIIIIIIWLLVVGASAVRGVIYEVGRRVPGSFTNRHIFFRGERVLLGAGSFFRHHTALLPIRWKRYWGFCLTPKKPLASVRNEPMLTDLKVKHNNQCAIEGECVKGF